MIMENKHFYFRHHVKIIPTLAIYLGLPNKRFIHCPGQNEKVSTLNSFGSTVVRNIKIVLSHK
jgi:hypothetical protein